LYAAADSFAQRAKLSENDTERKRWAKAAAYYRELARIEEDDEVGLDTPAFLPGHRRFSTRPRKKVRHAWQRRGAGENG